jgi:mRNA-degrading endonuclease RelE of RelBE toxin-antitoxin system
LTEWHIRTHPDFFKDLDKLGTRELHNFYEKKQKIKVNPIRQKHLSGGSNCYREPITDNVRLIYFLKEDTIWLLTISPHKKAFETYRKRLHSLKIKLGI